MGKEARMAGGDGVAKVVGKEAMMEGARVAAEVVIAMAAMQVSRSVYGVGVPDAPPVCEEEPWAVTEMVAAGNVAAREEVGGSGTMRMVGMAMEGEWVEALRAVRVVETLPSSTSCDP